ncbi:uncharacterized protein IL334_005496 [Kwoniella shivajii]|uniref:Uncharacterized protein n=1 Tax=Kwoniella shivajii TaxID=564305 RepID=A0ABZ1D3Q6_9TREE|nr:hypothetical protein IL334_005496 [Kwoniella shivajii]
MSQPTSPVLFNSVFSHADYFSTGGERPPIFTLSLTTSPTSSSSASQIPSTPDRGRSSSPLPTDDTRPPVELRLGSPQVLSSPRLSVKKESSAARKSVQFGSEKNSGSVNWARPLRVEKDPIASMRIFGASLQRSRRLNRSPAPSPSSSDDEPLTPSPVTPSSDDNVQIPLRGWSVFSSAKGLGVSGVAEWDTPITQSRESALETIPDFTFEPLDLCSSSSSTTPPKSSVGLPRSISKPLLRQTPPTQITISNPRMLATSQSLNSFSSPSNLQELRNLRQAATVLETEARRPIRPLAPNSSKDVPRERRIKRKAVPSIAESDIIDLYSSPSSTLATPISSTYISSSPDSDITSSSSSSTSSSSRSDDDPRRRNSCVDQIIVPRQLPGMGNSIFNRQRQLYQNHLATRSVVEISPRMKSTPNISIPPRIASLSSSSSLASSSRTAIGSLEESANISSASSISEQPLTPTSALSASQTEYFLSSVESAFKKLEFERAEMHQSKETHSKHKRAFSRFLGKKTPTSIVTGI